MAISKEDTARSYKGTVIGDNMVVSLNLKWLVQIITLCAMLVYSYYRIEMRIVELEDKFIQADTHIEDLLAKHEAEEAERIPPEDQRPGISENPVAEETPDSFEPSPSNKR